MGQYYRPVLQIDGTTAIYNREVGDSGYVMAKLTEHSWWGNEMVSAICRLIYQEAYVRLWWVGDYFDERLPHSKMSGGSVWKGDGLKLEPEYTSLDGKYLVNLDKDVFIDCDRYYKEADQDGWVIHPLPLLTACGNGRGGGDYYGPDEEAVGTWSGDRLAIIDVPPSNKYKEVLYRFKEEF